MATEANVFDRLSRLYAEGVIYHGQPTESLRAALAHASRGWSTVTPDYGRSPWGARSNEPVDEMVPVAQTIVYGVAVPWEKIKAWGETVYLRVLDLAAGIRGPGSPYCVVVEDLGDFLAACQRERVSCRALTVGGDSRNWYDEVETYRRLAHPGQCDDPAARAVAACWAGRYAHHRGIEIAEPYCAYWLAEFAALTVPRRLLRSVLVAWLAVRDWPAALAIAWQSRDFRECAERCRMAAELIGRRSDRAY